MQITSLSDRPGALSSHSPRFPDTREAGPIHPQEEFGPLLFTCSSTQPLQVSQLAASESSHAEPEAQFAPVSG
jgi:hypothetical protein